MTAAFRAAPHADVVFVAHTGLEHLSTVRDLWRNLPMDKTLHLRWWFVPSADVPRDEAEQTDWRYDWWETVDHWIGTTQQQESKKVRNWSAARSQPQSTHRGRANRAAIWSQD